MLLYKRLTAPTVALAIGLSTIAGVHAGGAHPVSSPKASTPTWQVIASPRTASGLQLPWEIAIDRRGPQPNKWMYVTDAATGHVVKLSTTGRYLGQWSFTTPLGTNPAPGAVAVGGQGNVFVADTPGNQIEKYYAPSDGLNNHWGTHGGGPNQFSAPSGIAIDSRGTVYVADTENSRIGVFSPAGTYLSVWPMPWTNGTGTSLPVAVATGPGDLVSAIGKCPGTAQCNNGHFDTQYNAVRFSPAGTVLQTWVGGTPHGGVGPTDKPWITARAIAVDRAGNWYVAGLMSFPKSGLYPGVQKYSPAGKLLRQWRVPSAEDRLGIAVPHGIALDPRGSIYITQGTQVLKLTP